MLALQGYGHGFRGALGASGGYICGSTACSGTTLAATTSFRRLQSLANEAGAGIGLDGKIAVDGVIGAQTVAKLAAISSFMSIRPDLPLITTMEGSTRPSFVAENASVFIAELEALISGEIQMPAETVGPEAPSAPTSPRPILTVGPRTGTTKPTQTPGVPGAGPHITASSPITAFQSLSPGAKLVASLGAVAALGALFVVVRRSRKPATVAGHRRRR